MMEHIHTIQNGHWVLEVGITGWSVVFDPFKLSQPLPVELGELDNLNTYLVLHPLDKLSMFSIHIPDVAWDLLDFAEKPLIVVLKGVKNLPEPWCGAERTMGYAKPYEDTASKLAQAYRQPLLVIPLSGSLVQSTEIVPAWAIDAAKNSKPQQVELPSYKVFALGNQGLLQRLKG